jgi:hypothetical protein
MVASSIPATEEAHEMLSTKIRTAIIGLVASGAIVAGTLAPVASADYKLTVTTTNEVNSNYSCENAKVTYENYGTLAESAQASGDLAGFNQAVAGATKTDEVAKAHGCSWAYMVAPKTTTIQPVKSISVRAIP